MMSRIRDKIWTSCLSSPSSAQKQSSHSSWDSALPIPKPSGFISALVVGVTAVACYANSLDGHFVFDDSEAIVNNEDLRPETPIWRLFENDFWGTKLTHNASHKSYRPLTVLSFRWNYWLSGGLNPAGFHATNILLHALVSALSLHAFNDAYGGNCPRAAFLSALLFAVHPVHAEAVSGVVGRADLLCALLYFACILCYVRGLNARSYNAALLLATAMVLAVAAMFCKEQGITVIGLCSAYDILVKNKIYLSRLLHPARLRSAGRHKSSDDEARVADGIPGTNGTTLTSDESHSTTNDCSARHSEPEADYGPLQGFLLRHAMLFVTGLGCVIFRLRLMASGPPTFQQVDNPASFHDSIVTRILSYNYVYALNAWLLLCPEWLCFDWSMGCIPLVKNTSDTRVMAAAVFWFALFCAAWRVFTSDSSRTQRSIAMSIAMIVIPFLPATNLLFRVGFVVAERVLYLPSSGFCMLVVTGIRQLGALNVSRTALQVNYVFLIVVFGARAGWRSAEWRNEATLFTAGLKVCPLNAKVHYNIAKNAADAGNRSLAVERYRHALELNARYDQAMNNLANILKDEGNLVEAEQLLRRAVHIRPEFAAAWMNLGIVLSGLKRHGEAELSYKMALAHRRKYPDCYYNLGNLYLERQHYNAAYWAWRNATVLRPTHTVAWSNMIIMLDSIGKMEEAEMVAQEALSVLPNEPALHFNLANTLGKVARFAEAEKHFTQAIQLDERNAVYYTNLGVLYHRWKKMDKAERFYRHALELNPRLQSAIDNLKLLYKNLRKPGARR